MSAATKSPAPGADAEWFKGWFGEDYLSIYPHRNSEEAEQVVELIRGLVGGRKIERVLDLACGAGRHSRALRRSWWTVGFDLSQPLLHLARKEDGKAPYVRGDMRALPFRDGSFSLVVNLFTSFGYFESDADHAKVIGMVAAVTGSGGAFILDYMNCREVTRSLIPYDERIVGDVVIEQRRTITPDQRFVEKRITLRGKNKSFVERVRLFSREDLQGMLEGAGFRIERVLGDYTGAEWNAASDRTILLAVKP